MGNTNFQCHYFKVLFPIRAGFLFLEILFTDLCREQRLLRIRLFHNSQLFPSQALPELSGSHAFALAEKSGKIKLILKSGGKGGLCHSGLGMGFPVAFSQMDPVGTEQFLESRTVISPQKLGYG